MKKDIVLLDGAAGTALWSMAQERGIARVPVWKYSIEHPELVAELSRRYIAAGSDMIQTNTFAVNSQAVKHSSDYTVEEVVSASVRIAQEAASGSGVGVYLSFGPPASLLKPYGTLTEEELRDMFAELCGAGVRAGAGHIMLETFMDVRMMEIAAQEAVKTGAEVICSMTFGKRGRTPMGDTVKKVVDTLSPLGIAAIGLNCSTDPVGSLAVIREFKELTSLPLYFKPNSGMGESYGAVEFADEVAPALDFVKYIGACCGSDESYIAELRKRI